MTCIRAVRVSRFLGLCFQTPRMPSLVVVSTREALGRFFAVLCLLASAAVKEKVPLTLPEPPPPFWYTRQGARGRGEGLSKIKLSSPSRVCSPARLYPR